jgi:hypothetical protein
VIEIVPEPAPSERAAIEAALALVQAEDEPASAPWVAAARAEAIDDGIA